MATDRIPDEVLDQVEHAIWHEYARDDALPVGHGTESIWRRYARAAVTAMPPRVIPDGVPRELREIAVRLASHGDTLAALYKEADARLLWESASHLKRIAMRLEVSDATPGR